MSVLRLNGIIIPATPDSVKVTDNSLKTETRMIDGEYRRDFRAYKRRISGQTRLMPLAEARAIWELLRGRGQLNAIYGEWDAIVRPHVQWRLDLVHGLRPGARAHAIPGAGHWVAYEAAEAFNATLLRYLTEQA
jgi:pimeloyl-ACP methyl ester carboxylesterase